MALRASSCPSLDKNLADITRDGPFNGCHTVLCPGLMRKASSLDHVKLFINSGQKSNHREISLLDVLE